MKICRRVSKSNSKSCIGYI